ncbi:MAG: NAD-dependent epimerase/dehydratase family protein [Bacteroidetes bacterium]|nr:NAD-dependent epimerase/dehydratase family protein [Bacteroidota bacterium]
MRKIGVTGQNGFLGYHLTQSLRLFKNEFEVPDFQRDIFLDEHKLGHFVSSCNVIIHLAAMNRDIDPDQVYKTNMVLVEKLVASLERTGARPHIIFASSTQESFDNPYGRSKRFGRELLEQWAKDHSAAVTSFVIPNVFGPFCKPFYNSVVSTFAYQIVNGLTPVLDQDKELGIIYISDLVDLIMSHIRELPKEGTRKLIVEPTCRITVNDLLRKLEYFHDSYIVKSTIPELQSLFDIHLFNTFRSCLDYETNFPVKLKVNSDPRGDYIEAVRTLTGGQYSYSTTHPGITRGNHFHIHKIERFIVLRGHASIKLRKIGTNDVIALKLSGTEPAFVDIPVWYTHNITNTGNEDLYTMFWSNQLFDPGNPDTFFENVE